MQRRMRGPRRRLRRVPAWRRRGTRRLPLWCRPRRRRRHRVIGRRLRRSTATPRAPRVTDTWAPVSRLIRRSPSVADDVPVRSRRASSLKIRCDASSMQVAITAASTVDRSTSTTPGIPRRRASESAADVPAGQRPSTSTASQATRSRSGQGCASSCEGLWLTIVRAPSGDTITAENGVATPTNRWTSRVSTCSAWSPSSTLLPVSSSPMMLASAAVPPRRATVTAAFAANPPPTTSWRRATCFRPTTISSVTVRT